MDWAGIEREWARPGNLGVPEWGEIGPYNDDFMAYEPVLLSLNSKALVGFPT